MTDTLLEAGARATENPNFLRAVTDMAERCAVVTQDAIYSANGIKLVEKGARIDSRLYDRLVQHKLREPIDRHLSIENPVGVPALLAAGKELTEQAVLPNMLAEALGSAARLLAPLRSLPLPASMKMCMYGSGALVDGTWFSAMASTKSMFSIFWYQSTVSLASLQR